MEKPISFIIRPWNSSLERKLALAIQHRYILSHDQENGMREPSLAEYLRYLLNKDLTELEALAKRQTYQQKGGQ